MRERVAQSAVKIGQKQSMLEAKDTSQEGIIFSSISASVYLCNCKVHQKLKCCAVPGWHDAPDEGKESQREEETKKLACPPGSNIYISRTELSKNVCLLRGQLSVTGECTHSHWTQNQWKSGNRGVLQGPWSIRWSISVPPCPNRFINFLCQSLFTSLFHLYVQSTLQ